MYFGVVVIGRNEGKRLQQCLSSVPSVAATVYVDSGSTDQSAQLARDHGVDVIELDSGRPFTAARARNAGLQHLRKIAPDLGCIQFVDGDCELVEGWPQEAVRFLALHPEIGAVTGRLRERDPERSAFNWLCEREWDGPAGEVTAFGGIVMIRIAALETTGGFREDVIAGEEPELAVRLRAAGWRLWRLDRDMAVHDAAMTRFHQWWRRSVRSGYADAQGAYLHGATPERHRVWESRRAWLWGVWFPLACLLAGLTFGAWGWAAWLIYPVQVVRQTMRNRGPLKQRAGLALFQVLARFPEALGQIRFLGDRLLCRQARLIEYK